MFQKVEDSIELLKFELPSDYVSAVYIFENFSIVEEDLTFVDRLSNSRMNYWMMIDDEFIGFASIVEKDSKLILDLIEIKKDFREKKLSLKLIDSLEEIFEEKLWVDGHYTVDGLTLWKRIPMLEDSEIKIVGDTDEFVENWELMETTF